MSCAVCSSVLGRSFLSVQLYPYNEEAGILICGRRQNGFVASLADIAWVDRDEEDDEDYFGNPR